MRYRVLLIEDLPDLRELLAQLLQTMGASTDSAGSAEEGWAMIQSVQYSAVLCDMTLPGMGGLDLLRLARRQGNQTPFIVISGDGGPDNVRAALAAGASAFLAKPFSETELLQALRSVQQAQGVP